MKKIFQWGIVLVILGLSLTFVKKNQVLAIQPPSIKIFVQWALDNPRDWDLIDTSVWSSQPTKSDPVGDVSLDGIATGDLLLNNVKGYIFSINVQGVIFAWYDHYSISSDANSITVTAWRDDPILFPIGSRQADVGIFKPLTFDKTVNQNNTDQSFIFYREGTDYDNLVGNLPANIILRQYSEFVPPSSVDTKSGIYLSDQKWQEHLDSQSLKGWRE